MKTYPRSRAMGETVREIIARLLLEECADPRLELVTVTGVDMSSDMTHANIFVAVHGDEARVAAAMAGLQAAKGRLRTMLGEAIRLRYVPELHFKIDPSIDEATRITDAILRERASGRVSPDEAVTGSDADES
jgi:ribosome-binding factor A